MSDPWRIAVAPMMAYTDRHCRYFLRLLAPRVRLYTEMVTAAAIVRGNPDQWLQFDPAEHPVALQLGGNDPGLLAEATRRAAARGYDEVNLNVGCPSDRVQEGAFGACLMKAPGLVADCVRAMSAASALPVTVKTRIGVDDCDSYDFLRGFVTTVAAAGCTTFIIHARKALLQGLSPRENRNVPPLRYDVVHRLRRDFPGLRLLINGGIATTAGVEIQLGAGLDGVMIGRKAYSDPCWLAELDARFLREGGPGAPLSREAVVEAMVDYAREQMAYGVRLHQISRHLLGLYHGLPGARAWRQAVTAGASAPGKVVPEVLLEALDTVRQRQGVSRTRGAMYDCVETSIVTGDGTNG